MADLTTVAAVKEWMAISAGITAADSTLQTLISACSADFLRATRRPDLLAADHTEVREGDGGVRMMLYHWPINSIASLKIGGVTVPVSADKIAPCYFIDTDIDPERTFMLYLIGQSFTDGASVQITYNAGYQTTPADISQAIADWVAYRYKQEPNLGAPQRRMSEGESMEQTQLDAPQTAKAVMDRYTRRIPSIARRFDEEQARRTALAARGGRQR